MRFGGFTVRSSSRAVMKYLKEQFAFGPGMVIVPPKDEVLFDWTCLHFPQGSHVDTYFRSVSNERRKLSAWALLGWITLEYAIDPKELEALIRESADYLDPCIRYARVRWHDVVVLLLISRVFPPTSDPYRSAYQHLLALARIDPSVIQWYDRLSEGTPSR